MAPNQIVHSLVNYCFENSKISNTPNYYCLKTHYCLKYLKYLIYTLLFLAKASWSIKKLFLISRDCGSTKHNWLCLVLDSYMYRINYLCRMCPRAWMLHWMPLVKYHPLFIISRYKLIQWPLKKLFYLCTY